MKSFSRFLDAVHEQLKKTHQELVQSVRSKLEDFPPWILNERNTGLNLHRSARADCLDSR